MIIVKPPAIHNISRLGQAQEQFTIQTLISKFTIEALNISIFPRAAWLDKHRSDFGLLKPFPHGLRRELRTVVAAEISWTATDRKQLRQYSHYVPASKTPANLYRQTFACELVHNVQHSQPATAFCPFRYEVIAPDMILAHRLAPMTGIGSCAQSPAFTGLFAYLKTFGFP